MTTKKRTKINFNIRINFNLRSTTPKSKPTTVRPIVRFNNEKIVLPSDFSIEPRYWNANSQRAKGTIMYDEETTLNEHIESRIAKIKSVFKAYTDKHNKFPEPDAFKTLVVNELNKTDDTEDEHPQIKDLVTFTEQFIREAESGLRVNDRGKPLGSYNTGPNSGHEVLITGFSYFTDGPNAGFNYAFYNPATGGYGYKPPSAFNNDTYVVIGVK